MKIDVTINEETGQEAEIENEVEEVGLEVEKDIKRMSQNQK